MLQPAIYFSRTDRARTCIKNCLEDSLASNCLHSPKTKNKLCYLALKASKSNNLCLLTVYTGAAPVISAVTVRRVSCFTNRPINKPHFKRNARYLILMSALIQEFHFARKTLRGLRSYRLHRLITIKPTNASSSHIGLYFLPTSA